MLKKTEIPAESVHSPLRSQLGHLPSEPVLIA